MKIVEQTRKEILDLKESYRSLAQNISIVFFTVLDISMIDVLYQFTHDFFIQSFQRYLNEHYEPCKPIVDKQGLVKQISIHLHKKIQRSLYKKDHKLLAFLIAIKKEFIHKNINSVMWKWFL